MMIAYPAEISTHTLTWSVTHCLKTFSNKYLNFNSHAHVERDIVKEIKVTFTAISTHTLTWSVTDVKPMHIEGYQFQLTRSRGA